MRLHRFYVGSVVALDHYVELTDVRIIGQWNKVLRYRPGQEVVLFDGIAKERLYVISELTARQARLELVTDLDRTTPEREVYLFWSLLKKDKNDWVLQKCTELGVSRFVPLLAERSEKTGFNLERAEKIVVEAAEQCGRSDIPRVHEPLLVQTALHTYGAEMPLFVCEQHEAAPQKPHYKTAGVLVGPEGGWSDSEKRLFATQELGKLRLGDFTLRAETASIVAAARLAGL